VILPDGPQGESPVQPFSQKYSGSLQTQITSPLIAIPHPQEGGAAKPIAAVVFDPVLKLVKIHARDQKALESFFCFIKAYTVNSICRLLYRSISIH
jgi:hypothetical protein